MSIDIGRREMEKIIGYHYTNKELLDFFGLDEECRIGKVEIIWNEGEWSPSYWVVEATYTRHLSKQRKKN